MATKNSSDYSTVDANYFDDILVALSPDDLLGSLVKDGAVSSTCAATQKQLELSRDTLTAQIITSGNIPAPPIAVANGFATAPYRLEWTLSVTRNFAGEGIV